MGLFGTLPLTRVSFLAFASLQNSRKLSCSYSSTATRLMGINYILKYDYVPDVLEKRGPYREGHLGLAKRLIEEGKCLSGGPTSDPGAEVPSGAIFIFTDLESAQLFAKEDPYIEAGIVTKHEISEWNVVVSKE